MRTPRKLSRRDFLKLASLSLAGLALRPVPPDDEAAPLGLGRITRPGLALFDAPNETGSLLKEFVGDELVDLLDERTVRRSADRLERWYRAHDGYVQAAYVQRVMRRLNSVYGHVPTGGLLGEITVPFSDTRNSPSLSSAFAFRLYYQGVVRVVGVERDAAGLGWYRLVDDRFEREHFVLGAHVRIIPLDRLSPISPDVSPERKVIRVDLREQSLVAYEDESPVYRASLSGGRFMWQPDPNAPVTSWTPAGVHRVIYKRPSRTMLDGDYPTINGHARPAIPWVSYFTTRGDAFHGVYWHDNFGVPMSHGCLNLRPADALWIYRWTTPQAGYFDDMLDGEDGTRVEIAPWS